VSQDPIIQFENERASRIEGYPQDLKWKSLSNEWLIRAFEQQYMYNFSWHGRPIIQLPNDIVAMQEIIWAVKPDLIIETGIAHGGSLVMSASMLAMIEYCEAITEGILIDPRKPKRKVLGIDIDIRSHNRAAIQAHPLASHITMIEGSSLDEDVVAKVKSFSSDFETIMVCLDSNHTHDHVAKELEAYAHLTSVDSYCVVFDTIVEDLPEDAFPNRPWAPGNNPKTAVTEFLGLNPNFAVDASIESKLQVTVAPSGYLKRLS
jgi:cephalosporin hydroxylase